MTGFLYFFLSFLVFGEVNERTDGVCLVDVTLYKALLHAVAERWEVHDAGRRGRGVVMKFARMRYVT